MSRDYTPEESNNIAVVEAYFSAVSSGGETNSVADFYAPDVEQEEFPNALLPKGAKRNFQQLGEAWERGRALMQSQTFDIDRKFALGSFVITESKWTGTIGVDAGPFKAGQVLRARFAQVFELRDGKILGLRNYDCVEPW